MFFKGLHILFVLLLASHVVYSADIDSVKTHFIDDVMVTTRLVKTEVIPVQELSGEQLQSLSSHSVADALRYFSGAQIKDYGGVGGLKTVNIRSLGTNHVGVFFDGVQLGNAQNGVVDLGRFSLDNMEAITMYNGQKSDIFQSAKDYGSASSIYMTTRKPSFEVDKNYNLNLGLKAGSFKTVNPSVLWENKISDKISSLLSAEYLYTSGEYPFTYAKEDGYDTTSIRQNGDIRYLRAEAAVFGQLDMGEWMAKAYWYNSERGYPGASVREEPGVFENEDRQWDENFFVQASLRKRFASWYNFKVNLKFANDFLEYMADSELESDEYTQKEFYSSLVNLFNITPWASVAFATDFQYNTLDANLSVFAYPERYQSLSSLAGSVVYQRFKAQVSALFTYVHDITKTSDTADDITELTPSFVISYQPFASCDFNIRAFYKRVFRMPTFNDLYYTSSGSTSLDPEYTNQYNIGVTYGLQPYSRSLKSLQFQADAYYNEVEDKIIATPTTNQFRWSMLNLGYVEIKGIDLMAQAEWLFSSVGLTTRLNYTYQKAQDFTDPSSDYYGGQIPYTPWHSASVILGVDYRGWALNYSFIYTGERYESVANIAENYSLPWYTSDVSLTKSFKVKSVELRATAELNNIFNQQYEVVQCYPMPGINYKLKLNVIL